VFRIRIKAPGDEGHWLTRPFNLVCAQRTIAVLRAKGDIAASSRVALHAELVTDSRTDAAAYQANFPLQRIVSPLLGDVVFIPPPGAAAAAVKLDPQAQQQTVYQRLRKLINFLLCLEEADHG
jgi:hypothetical protein